MGNLKWVFFDIGSTLVLETKSEEYRINEVLKGTNIKKEDFINEYIDLARQNKDAFNLLVEKYHLKKIEWPAFLDEKIEGVEEVLEHFKKYFHLGIIANQPKGTLERLENWGIKDYFEVIIPSYDVGLKKPQKGIFLLALKEANCNAENAMMIGDRLENDILPAMELGFKTIWLKTSYGAYGNLSLLPKRPDYIFNSVLDLKNIDLKKYL